MPTWMIAARTLSVRILPGLLAVGCGVPGPSGPSPAEGTAPVIHRFLASPDALPEGGGTVTLSWEVRGATALTLDPGIGPVAPVTVGDLQLQVSRTTGFTLRATSPLGSTVGVTSVTVDGSCDASGAFRGSCYVFRKGRCLDYSNVSGTDAASLLEFCTALTGNWNTTSPCPTEGRVGTCKIPASLPITGLECSPEATVLERFYPPSYSQADAATECGYLAGATFTGG